MKNFTEYIGSQFGNPRGIMGRICCLIMNVINRAMYRQISAVVPSGNQSTVLDIGYGNGYLIRKLYRKSGAHIYGIDISEDMRIAAAKRNRRAVEKHKVHLFVGDCSQLKFKDSMFDAVTSVNTIYFWEDTSKVLSEINRVLKPDGVFYNVAYTKEWLQKLSYTNKGFRFFDKEVFIRLGKDAGFSKVSIKDISPGKSYIVRFRK